MPFLFFLIYYDYLCFLSTFSTFSMLLDLCWSSLYAFKMLMKDLKIFLSQLGSFDMVKSFACELEEMYRVSKFAP